MSRLMVEDFLIGAGLSLSRVVRDPRLWLLQVQSCLCCIGLAIAWFWASLSRRKEIRKIRAAQKAGNDLAFLDPDMAYHAHLCQKGLPMVSVILAVKGVGEQSMENWRSQLVTLYGGAVEFLFCVESEEDLAYTAVQSLQREMKDSVKIRLVVAGLASQCSQQIHNQLAGAKASDDSSKYILFLDDDIQCHPGTIGSLVKAMETGPDVFLCTGYSFDVPSSYSLAAYCAMAYRLPLLTGLSTGGQVFFVWGGCIMMRKDDINSNKHGMLTALKKNGYSNDLILTSVAGLNKRVVWSPAVAIFPGRMSGNWTMQRYWNYVCRQIFALLTYCSPFSFYTNRLSFICYTYLSWAASIPVVISTLHLVIVLGSISYSSLQLLNGGDAHYKSGVLNWILAQSVSQIGLSLALINLLCAGVVCLAGWRLFDSVLTLCNLLSPEQKPFRLENISFLLSVLGMLVNFLLLPIIATLTFLKGEISWAGIRYVRRNGIVAKVVHPHEEADLTETMELPTCLHSPERKSLQSIFWRIGGRKASMSNLESLARLAPYLAKFLYPETKKIG